MATLCVGIICLVTTTIILADGPTDGPRGPSTYKQSIRIRVRHRLTANKLIQAVPVRVPCRIPLQEPPQHGIKPAIPEVVQSGIGVPALSLEEEDVAGGGLAGLDVHVGLAVRIVGDGFDEADGADLVVLDDGDDVVVGLLEREEADGLGVIEVAVEVAVFRVGDGLIDVRSAPDVLPPGLPAAAGLELQPELPAVVHVHSIICRAFSQVLSHEAVERIVVVADLRRPCGRSLVEVVRFLNHGEAVAVVVGEAIGDGFGVDAIREDGEVACFIMADVGFVDVGDRVGQVVRAIVGRLAGIAFGVGVDFEPVAEAVEDPGLVAGGLGDLAAVDLAALEGEQAVERIVGVELALRGVEGVLLGEAVDGIVGVRVVDEVDGAVGLVVVDAGHTAEGIVAVEGGGVAEGGGEALVAGRFVDFHALRHTTSSLLAASGAHAKVAQAIMRHSDINSTLARYTVYNGQEAEAVAKLPGFAKPDSKSQRREATG